MPPERIMGSFFGLTGHPNDLAPHRAESRLSAYVYGSVLVLAATAGVSDGAIRSGEAVLIVLGATFSTYVAHVLADVVGAVFAGAGALSALVAELRDSVPVISAGAPSVALFGAAAGGWPSPTWSQVIACAVLVGRLGTIGLVYRRLRAPISLRRAVSFGLLTALVATLAAVVKLTLAH
jgi:hypothetical protein